jgi:hypothetical protein
MVCSGTPLPYHVSYEDKKYAITYIFPPTPWNILGNPKVFENHRLGTTALKTAMKSTNHEIPFYCPRHLVLKHH